MALHSVVLLTMLTTQGALLEREIQNFFDADRPRDREDEIKSILEMDVAFDIVFDRLKSGRHYVRDVETGLREESLRDDRGVEHRYVFLVPEDYDPEKSYRVCFYLHGGVNRSEAWEEGGEWWRRFDRFESSDQISVFPSSWRASLWWTSGQVESLRSILDRLKRDYNVDESLVFLFGVSDGGTGVYYFAVKDPTPWAAFFPFIGHPAVLENPATGVEGQVFFENLANRPLFIVNGETDRLYPVRRVEPYIVEFQRAGVDLLFLPQPGGHNTRWWNGERERIATFMAEHARASYPDKLVWQTDDPETFGRVDWLVVDELAPQAGSGRVDVRRTGNRVAVTTRRVRRFRLLLSPEQFDFEEPVVVTTNGRESFAEKPTKDREALLRWAAVDDDRKRLFGAEVAIAVPP